MNQGESSETNDEDTEIDIDPMCEESYISRAIVIIALIAILEQYHMQDGSLPPSYAFPTCG